MQLHEFDVPMHIMPDKPYWMREQRIVIFPTDKSLPKSDYWGPTEATRIIIYDTDHVNIQKHITNLVVFSNFLNRNFGFLRWMFDKSFSEKNLVRYERHTEDLEKYVSQNCQKSDSKPDWYYKVDFDKYPLYELTPDPTTISFGKYFGKYMKLSDKDPYETRIKELIDFFSYSSLSQMIMNKIYDNSNLQVSNCFVIIEALVLMDIKDQTGIKPCPHCGESIKGQRPIMEMVSEFIDSKIKDEEIKNIFLEILYEHYRTRNRFFHAAKFDRFIEKINQTIEKIGSNHVKLSDEIKHGGAANMGLSGINSFLRFDLLERLR